jgi:hypothetical protein
LLFNKPRAKFEAFKAKLCVFGLKEILNGSAFCCAIISYPTEEALIPGDISFFLIFIFFR